MWFGAKRRVCVKDFFFLGGGFAIEPREKSTRKTQTHRYCFRTSPVADGWGVAFQVQSSSRLPLLNPAKPRFRFPAESVADEKGGRWTQSERSGPQRVVWIGGLGDSHHSLLPFAQEHLFFPLLLFKGFFSLLDIFSRGLSQMEV